MAESGSTFVLVATYPDEAAARDDYQVVKDAHAAGLVWGLAAGAVVGGIFPPSVLAAAAAGGVLGGVGGHLARGMSRSQAKELGDVIGPGQAGLVVVGDSKVQDAIKRAVTRADQQTARELDVKAKDLDRTLQQAVKEM